MIARAVVVAVAMLGGATLAMAQSRGASAPSGLSAGGGGVGAAVPNGSTARVGGTGGRTGAAPAAGRAGSLNLPSGRAGAAAGRLAR